MTIKTLALITALALPSLALADDQKTDKTSDQTKKETLSEADLAIVAHLHHVNVMEVDMGKLAQKQGTAPVKRYGEMLVRDHSTADKDVIAFAKKRGIAKIPADKPVTEADKTEMKATMEKMTKLKTLRGAEFDRSYLQMMVEGHDKELTSSDPAIASTTDAELKTMLENRKTSLQRHRDAALELQKGNAQASK